MITKNITCDLCGRVLGTATMPEDKVLTGYVCGIQLVTHEGGEPIVETFLDG